MFCNKIKSSIIYKHLFSIFYFSICFLKNFILILIFIKLYFRIHGFKIINIEFYPRTIHFLLYHIRIRSSGLFRIRAIQFIEIYWNLRAFYVYNFGTETHTWNSVIRINEKFRTRYLPLLEFLWLQIWFPK